MQQNPTQTFNDAIPGDRAEEMVKALHDHRSRLIIKEVVEEHLSSTDFADKIKHIQHEALEADPARNKLKQWVIGLITAETTSDAARARLDGQVDARLTAQLDARGWKKKTLYWSVGIGLTTIAVGLVMMIIGLMTLAEAQKANQIKTSEVTNARQTSEQSATVR